MPQFLESFWFAHFHFRISQKVCQGVGVGEVLVIFLPWGAGMNSLGVVYPGDDWDIFSYLLLIFVSVEKFKSRLLLFLLEKQHLLGWACARGWHLLNIAPKSNLKIKQI